jgi:hypothetical protein
MHKRADSITSRESNLGHVENRMSGRMARICGAAALMSANSKYVAPTEEAYCSKSALLSGLELGGIDTTPTRL